ncbi:MAG: ATP-binding cassette domain-containing protein [Candidatus Berkiellales bacterium]
MSPTLPDPPSSQSLIQVDSVSLFDGKRCILDSVSLTLSAGQIVSVIGPNGAGKTTLIKIVVGLTKPSKGRVTSPPNLRIGYMPQKLQIDPTFPITVERFLQLGQATSLDHVLAEVGVLHVLHHPLHAISGGELQRVLLARALLRQPELLVLDEPAQGVDLLGQGELYDLIGKIRDRHGCAILLVSHDLSVVMAQTDVVVCLNQHVCCSGHPEKVSRDPAFTALFGPVAGNLAFYTHHHDHQHDIAGHVPHKKDHHHD